MAPDGSAWWFAARLRALGEPGLADLVERLDAAPEARRVLVPAEALAELVTAPGWGEVRAWLEGRGVEVVPVVEPGVL